MQGTLVGREKGKKEGTRALAVVSARYGKLGVLLQQEEVLRACGYKSAVAYHNRVYNCRGAASKVVALRGQEDVDA